MLGESASILSKKLGYIEYIIDPHFYTGDRKHQNPDMVIYSVQCSDTIVLEWTEGNISTSKLNQITAFSAIDRASLLTNLGIPQEALSTHCIAIVINAKYVDDYEKTMGEEQLQFALLCYQPNGSSGSLLLRANHFAKKEVENVFSKGIEIKHIPKYVNFSPENIEPIGICNRVKAELIRIIEKGIVESFSTEEICLKICSEHIWNYLSRETKGDITGWANRTISALMKHEQVKKAIFRGTSKDEYRIDKKAIRYKKKSICSAITGSEIRKSRLISTHQPSLPFY